jgi:hypothetical protein
VVQLTGIDPNVSCYNNHFSKCIELKRSANLDKSKQPQLGAAPSYTVKISTDYLHASIHLPSTYLVCVIVVCLQQCAEGIFKIAEVFLGRVLCNLLAMAVVFVLMCGIKFEFLIFDIVLRKIKGDTHKY